MTAPGRLSPACAAVALEGVRERAGVPNFRFWPDSACRLAEEPHVPDEAADRNDEHPVHPPLVLRHCLVSLFTHAGTGHGGAPFRVRWKGCRKVRSWPRAVKLA